MTVNHFYFKDGDVIYKDLTLFTNEDNIRKYREPKINDDDIFMDSDLLGCLADGEPGVFDQALKPKKGSSLYVAPKSDVALDDIRRNYTVKRKVDGGDYNVISVKNIRYYSSYEVDIAVFPSAGVAYAEHTRSWFSYDKTSLYQRARAVIPDVRYDGMVSSHRIFLKRLLHRYDDIGKVLSGTKKPWVTVSALDLNGSIELDYDRIYQVYLAGEIGNRATEERMNNMLTQLNILNNCNWREYPLTMNLLRSALMQSSTYYKIVSHKSSYPKQIQNILERHDWSKNNTSEKDYNLALKFMNMLLNMHGTVFTDLASYTDKTYSFSRADWFMDIFYSKMIRIKPKTYEEAIGS